MGIFDGLFGWKPKKNILYETKGSIAGPTNNTVVEIHIGKRVFQGGFIIKDNNVLISIIIDSVFQTSEGDPPIFLNIEPNKLKQNIKVLKFPIDKCEFKKTTMLIYTNAPGSLLKQNHFMTTYSVFANSISV